MVQTIEFYKLPIPLDRDRFVRELLRQLTESVERSVGEEQARELVAQVGEQIGEQINVYYRAALRSLRLNREQVAAAMVDLKRRLEGDFYVISQDDEKIVLGNRACPFGAKVKGRSSLCMMTSSVFGIIASRNIGYAKVELQETIARGDDGCRIVVHLKPGEEAEKAPGREFNRSLSEASLPG
ncbi:MAG TPA: methanogen output domain 1-containing protein [Burkholderiales bacterium]